MTRARILVRRLLFLQSALLVVGSTTIGISDGPGRWTRAVVPLMLAGIFFLIALALAAAGRLGFVVTGLGELLFAAGTLAIVHLDSVTLAALVVALCVLCGSVLGAFGHDADL
ncbi:MAG: hypothetical protein ACR2GX_09455 [Candidatus Dormibacteria bacterium]